MLLVDRVIDVAPGASIRAVKTVSISEPALQGHFPPPGRPIMPGVLIVEALAQACALLVHATEPFDATRQPLALLGIDRARFRRPVGPGDKLDLHCEVVSRRGGTWRFRARALVGDHLAAEAVILAAVGEADS
jgi:3-hydroxyacyl-[acyl-carrier-protein] dehydratase